MGTDSHFAAQELCLGDVAYGSLADMATALPNVRFTPESGHSRARSPQARFCAVNGRARGPDSNNGGRAGKNSE